MKYTDLDFQDTYNKHNDLIQVAIGTLPNGTQYKIERKKKKNEEIKWKVDISDSHARHLDHDTFTVKSDLIDYLKTQGEEEHTLYDYAAE
jgi:hypothetical protein